MEAEANSLILGPTTETDIYLKFAISQGSYRNGRRYSFSLFYNSVEINDTYFSLL